MKRLLRICALGCLCVAEPVLHTLGIAHPEGMSAYAMNLVSLYRGE